MNPLTPIESLVRAEVNVWRESQPTLNFGHYRFATLPRLGEFLSVSLGGDQYELVVREIKHLAYTEDSTPTIWDAMTVINCEINDRA